MRATTTNGAERARSFGRAVAALGATAVAGLVLLPAMAMPASAASADPSPVTIQNFSFSPNFLEISVGTTVQWTNAADQTAHTVTADDGKTFSSPTIAPGKTFSFTFNQANTYTYHCAIHPSMTATIKVDAAAAPPPPPTTTTTAAPGPSTTSAPATTATTAHRTTTTTRPAATSTTRATAASTT